ncbi:MAG: hypothetical protein AAFO58_07520 [Pseudomonadota bacterium]
MKTFLAAAALALFPMIGTAQDVSDCDWRARADAVVEPWSTFSRTFANGDVRLALLDVVEPAAGALHILVISPPYDELGIRQCKVVSYEGSMGFGGALFEDLAASYDPAIGLTFDMDVQTFDPATSGFAAAVLRITVNQATGNIGAALFQ